MTPPAKWIEVRALVPSGWEELVAEALTGGPCTTVAFGPTSGGTAPAPIGFEFVRTFIPAHADSAALRAEIEGRVARLAEDTGAEELRGLALRFHALPPEDYATSWKRSWRAFRVGRLCVLAPWSTSKPRSPDVILNLEPGGAFGSGRHATTRMMLRLVSERIVGGERVLDAGSGSGILAVAAALLGAHESFGFDVDPNATPYARELARANGVERSCRFETGGFELLGVPRHAGEAFDVVLANIYSDVVQAHADDLRGALGPRGWFAFSGCAVQNEAATKAAISAAGLVVDEVRSRGPWCTFIGRRRA